MSNILPVCLAAGLLGLAAVPASAAPSSADRDFAIKAASGGISEVETAQLAQQRATLPQTKQFAQRMIDDHTAANNELMQIARQANITLPSQPTGKDASEAQTLQGLNGAQFDQAYAQDELRDHQQTVQLFRKEADSGQDPTLKAFALKTLPVLQQHLQLAEALNKH